MRSISSICSCFQWLQFQLTSIQQMLVVVSVFYLYLCRYIVETITSSGKQFSCFIYGLFFFYQSLPIPLSNDLLIFLLSLQWSKSLHGIFGETNQSELAAFISYALAFPNNFLALVDTYDVSEHFQVGFALTI